MQDHLLLDDYGFEDAAELKKNAADYGLTIGAFHRSVRFIIMHFAVMTRRQESIQSDILKNGIRAAAEAGAKVMVLNCCGGARNEDPDAYFLNVRFKPASAFKNCCGREGVVLAVETVH